MIDTNLSKSEKPIEPTTAQIQRWHKEAAFQDRQISCGLLKVFLNRWHGFAGILLKRLRAAKMDLAAERGTRKGWKKRALEAEQAIKEISELCIKLYGVGAVDVPEMIIAIINRSKT
ncbi:MAG: hypothetical protein KOO63_08280 [Bacteroidales bacterium]|nr:hypothetical protein [Candidatus Latescibacterota bacterium]